MLFHILFWRMISLDIGFSVNVLFLLSALKRIILLCSGFQCLWEMTVLFYYFLVCNAFLFLFLLLNILFYLWFSVTWQWCASLQNFWARLLKCLILYVDFFCMFFQHIWVTPSSYFFKYFSSTFFCFVFPSLKSSYTYFRQLDMLSLFTEVLFIFFPNFLCSSDWLLFIELLQNSLPSPTC